MVAQKLQQVWADEAEKVRSFISELKTGDEIGRVAPKAPAAAHLAFSSSPASDPDITSYPEKFHCCTGLVLFKL